MTTPGGVPNAPKGALTFATLESMLQDLTPEAMRTRAADRMPGIFHNGTGGNPLSDLSFHGIIMRLWAAFNSLVANADPADINSPDDLPGLLVDFIEDLPFVGELVGLIDAIKGTYEGDDAVLLEVQAIFAPIQKLLQLISGVGSGFPTLTQLNDGWIATLAAKLDLSSWQGLLDGVKGSGGGTISDLINKLQHLGSSGQFDAAQLSNITNIPAIAQSKITGLTTALAGLLPTSTWQGFLDTVKGSGGGVVSDVTNRLANLTATGGFDASALTNVTNIPAIAQSKISGLVTDLGTALSTASTANTKVENGFATLLTAFVPAATPTNVPATDATTFASAVTTALSNGTTVYTFNASNHAWTIPAAAKRAWAGVFNGADGGGVGSTATGGIAAGGAAGLDGGYHWKELDLTGLTPGTDTLDITVGAGAASPGGTGGVSSVVASTGTLHQGVSGTSSFEGMGGRFLLASKPGSGGKGGQANSSGPSGSVGDDGESAGNLAGGTGGAGRNNSGTATAGSNGTNGDTATDSPLGGSGGGGGGGAAGTSLGTYTGGKGGNGGFPGGGPGGGGAASCTQALATKVGGQPGTPGNGSVVVVVQ